MKFGSLIPYANLPVMFRSVPWFVELAEFVKEVKVDAGINITDILIKSNAEIQLGILKSFYGIGFFDFVNKEKCVELAKLRLSVNDLLAFKEIFKQNEIITPEQEKNTSIDFSLAVEGFGVLRFNYSKSEGNIVMNVRYLDYIIPDFDTVGYPDNYIQFISDLVDVKKITLGKKTVGHRTVQRGGLIIHNGPTGSGKTTAIASEIKYLASYTTGLVVTYEEPIEYRFVVEPRVIQFEINRDIKRNEIIRHVLRNNPSVIILGEIREAEEMKAMIDIASRGHLVITTIHAENVFEVFKLMASVLNESELSSFATSLKAIVSHRLFVNIKGQPVTLFEIFMNKEDRIKAMLTDIKNALSLKGLYNMLYKDRNVPNFMSFQDHVYMRYNEKKLSADEVDFVLRGITNAR